MATKKKAPAKPAAKVSGKSTDKLKAKSPGKASSSLGSAKKSSAKSTAASTKKSLSTSARAKASTTSKKSAAKPVGKTASKSNAKPAKKTTKATPTPSLKKGIMKKATPAKSAAKAPAKKAAAKKTTTPSVKKTAVKKVEKKVEVKKAVEKKVVEKKAVETVAPPTPSAAIQIAPLSEGKPTKAIVLSRGNGAPRRPKKSTGRATPKLEPRVKKDNSKNEEMFERTQSAPTISAPKITEFFQTSGYQTPEPVKPKANVRYSDKDLKMFKELIESEKEKTLDELRMLKERLEDLTNYEASEETAVYSMHMAEQGSEAVEREKTYAQIQRTTDYLRKLDEAITRIAEKTYGICRQCGILIAKERLMAVPITTLSASWKLRQQCPTDGVDRIGK